jgi:hypothetical protein
VGRTALYRDPVPFRPARSEVQLEADALLVRMPDGWTRRHALHGVAANTGDGFVGEKVEMPAPAGRQERTVRTQRRFVRMLVLEGTSERFVVITPPEQGAVAPNVVSVPEAPTGAAIVDADAWEALADWILGGGRLAALSIADLARLACIATPHFAALIGEVAAQRALELVWAARGPLRGSGDLDSALHPLTDAAKTSTRAAEALVSALAHAAGATRRRRRW